MLLKDWEKILIATDTGRHYSKHTKDRYNKVWDLIERSLPISVNDEWWVVSIKYERRTEEYFLDLRRWEITDDLKLEPNPEDGITMLVPDWLKLLEVIGKLLGKHTKIRKTNGRTKNTS